MTPTEPQPSELSFPVDLTALDPAGARFVVEAGAEERRRIAKRLEVSGVEALAGEIRLTPSANGVSVNGRLQARLLRQCVASLEILTEEIDEPFTIAFVRAPEIEPERDEDLAEDSPEPLEADSLDLGELLVQELALAMNPYPRKAGAPPIAASSRPAAAAESPFAILGASVAERDQQE